ncbi:MAG: HEAT repeat domain-containing protein, partial [Planctomycetaceae bacterium]|nr:HEAT repeat domain-containing protein [Planctomycetaceae bacterium]
STFESRQQPEVITTEHVAFRPIDATMGGDGALYIADWYNPIIQHGEVDFRDERRDHVHGRIWRVTYKGNKPVVERPRLVDASTADLLQQLESPDGWTRRQAQRLLKERGPDVLVAAKSWARQLDNTHPEFHRRRLEALWVYLAHDVVEPELLESLLVCRDAGVRAAATRIIGDWHERLTDPLALLEQRVADDHPRVRLEAIRALALIPDPRSIEIAARALDPATERTYQYEVEGERKPAAPEPLVWDEWLDYALFLTARELQPVWEPALLSGQINFDGNARHMAYILKSAGSPATVPALLRMLAVGQVDEASQADVLDVIASFGRAEDLQHLLQLAIDSQLDGVGHRYLHALVEAFHRHKGRPSGPFDGLISRADQAAPAVTATAAQLVGLWKWDGGREWLMDIAKSADRPQETRQAAIDGLADFGGDAAKTALQTLASPDSSPAVQQRAIIGLLGVAPQDAARRAAVYLQTPTDPAATVPLFSAFVNRPAAADIVAEALEKSAAAGKSVPADVAVIGLRTIRASGKKYERLEAALAKAGGVSSEPVQMSPEELAAMVDQVQSSGLPVQGEQVFRRTELGCLKCHSVGDAGGLVGPNLVSLGATAQVDYLLQSLLDPNAKVKEGYHTVVIVDNDGKQWSGIKLRQTDTAVVLRDAEGREFEVPLASIDVETPGISLMPAGLTEKLTRRELVDLTAFLSALGRLPEYTLGQSQLARRWQAMQATPEAATQLRRVSYAQAATDDVAFRWQTAYSAVSGALPLDQLPEVAVKNRVAAGTRGMSFVRCEIEVSQPGEGVLKFNTPVGLQGWLGAQPVELQPETPIQLTPGRHRLTISIDRSEREEPLAIELQIPESSTAIAKFVGGV